MTDPDDTTMQVRAFYEKWVRSMVEAGAERPMPAFRELSAEQLVAWMHAYAANLTVAAHMSTAVLLTTGGPR